MHLLLLLTLLLLHRGELSLRDPLGLSPDAGRALLGGCLMLRRGRRALWRSLRGTVRGAALASCGGGRG